MATTGYVLAVGTTPTPIAGNRKVGSAFRSMQVTNIAADPDGTGLPVVHLGGADVDTTSKYGAVLAPGDVQVLPFDPDACVIRTTAASVAVLLTGGEG